MNLSCRVLFFVISSVRLRESEVFQYSNDAQRWGREWVLSTKVKQKLKARGVPRNRSMIVASERTLPVFEE